MIDYKWNGRIYVDEPRITPEQYKTFFGIYEFGISFDVANAILKNRTEGYKDEVVPADELNDIAKDAIKETVYHERKASGVIVHAGQELHWNWDFEWTADEEHIDLKDVPDWVLAECLRTMLDDECHWGMITN